VVDPDLDDVIHAISTADVAAVAGAVIAFIGLGLVLLQLRSGGATARAEAHAPEIEITCNRDAFQKFAQHAASGGGYSNNEVGKAISELRGRPAAES
jgi:hypothetical protein